LAKREIPGTADFEVSFVDIRNISRMILLHLLDMDHKGILFEREFAHGSHGQGLNARDNGMNVIVGVRKDG
jgi:hypothetical protein